MRLCGKHISFEKKVPIINIKFIINVLIVTERKKGGITFVPSHLL
jgi:hypothetical protein